MKKEIQVKIGNEILTANPKKFKTGSEGYGAYGKIMNGAYQVSCNIIKIKSRKIKGGKK